MLTALRSLFARPAAAPAAPAAPTYDALAMPPAREAAAYAAARTEASPTTPEARAWFGARVTPCRYVLERI